MSEMVADKDNKIRELMDQLNLKERETVLLQQRVRITVEEEIRTKYDKMQRDFEQKILEQTVIW
jgi:hypothetical protein